MQHAQAPQNAPCFSFVPGQYVCPLFSGFSFAPGNLPLLERDVRNLAQNCKQIDQQNDSLLTENRENDVRSTESYFPLPTACS